MPFILRELAYQSPKTIQKRRSQFCYCRHECQFTRLKPPKCQVLKKRTLRSRLAIPPALQGVNLDLLQNLGITITPPVDSEEPLDLIFV